MSEIRFYLKDSSKPKTVIYMSYRSKGIRGLKWYTGVTIEPRCWSDKNQKAKPNFDTYTQVNQVLDNMKNFLNTMIREAQSEGTTITLEEIKSRLDDRYKKTIVSSPAVESGLFADLKRFIELHSTTKVKRTTQKYQTLHKTLKEFSEQTVGYAQLHYGMFDQNFWNAFIIYLTEDKKVYNETVNKYLSNLKTFLKWAFDEGLHTNNSYIKFKKVKSLDYIFVLTRGELQSIFDLDLSDNLKLYQVRELFCFACYTGLRYSDWIKVQRQNIRNGVIHLTIEKTKEVLRIKLPIQAQTILERNDYKFHNISNQKTNQYLKEIAKKLDGFDEVIEIDKMSKTSIAQIKKHKYDLLTCHTARRTFITLSLELGVRPEALMKITGHKNIQTMMKYVKVTDSTAGDELCKAWDRQ